MELGWYITMMLIYDSVIVISGGVAVFSLGDMIIYNRRKRKVFFEEQHMLLQQRLAEARVAAAHGTADEDQMLLLNRERAAEEAEQVRKRKKGLWNAFKGLFNIEGLSEEDRGSKLDLLGEEGLRKMGTESSEPKSVEGLSAPKEEKPSLGIIQAVEDKRRDGERELQERGMKGGPLDTIAEQAITAGKSKGGWTSWMTSR